MVRTFLFQVLIAPCTLHPAPCTLHPAPCTLHPAPCLFQLTCSNDESLQCLSFRLDFNQHYKKRDSRLSKPLTFSHRSACLLQFPCHCLLLMIMPMFISKMLLMLISMLMPHSPPQEDEYVRC